MFHHIGVVLLIAGSLSGMVADQTGDLGPTLDPEGLTGDLGPTLDPEGWAGDLGPTLDPEG